MLLYLFLNLSIIEVNVISISKPDISQLFDYLFVCRNSPAFRRKNVLQSVERAIVFISLTFHRMEGVPLFWQQYAFALQVVVKEF